MRVLVSGSTGFIGSALVTALSSAGNVVHPIVRRAPNPGEAGLDLERRRFDASALPGAGLADVDVVYHLAGEPLTPRRWGPEKLEAIRASRSTTTSIIARAIATCERPPATFVVMSAVGYYGSRGDEVLDERSGAGEGFVAEVCRAWEAAAAPARAVGVRTVHARTGVVLSGSGGLLRTVLPVFRLGLGGRLGSGRQWMSCISLADEIAALQFAATSPELVGPCNFTAPNPVTNAQFTAELGTALGRPARIPVPRPLLKVVLGRRVTDDLALTSQRVVPKRLSELGFTFRHPELADALAAGLAG